MERERMSRRQLLKTGSAWWAASMLGYVPLFSGCNHSSSGAQEQPKKDVPQQTGRSADACTIVPEFTIVLHGLFFIELRDPDSTDPADEKIRIFTPDCSNFAHGKHVYKAGSLNKPLSTIKPHSDYHSGWKSIYSQLPTFNLPPVRGYARKWDTNKRFFSLYLPYPKSIQALRAVAGQLTTSSGSSLVSLPLVTALSYGKDRPAQAPLSTSAGSWDSSVNFHIYAEPECKLSCDQILNHSEQTLEAIQELLKDPKYMVKPTKPYTCPSNPPTEIPRDDCPRDLGAAGVTSDEEKSLWELPGAQPCVRLTENEHFFAVHMPTCASVVLTP